MKNIKIGMRLLLAFGIISSILLTIGLLSIYSINKLQVDLLDVGTTALPYTSSLGEIKSSLLTIGSVQRTMLIKDLPEEISNSLKDTLATARELYSKAFNEIDALALTKKDVEELEHLRALISDWRVSNDDFFS